MADKKREPALRVRASGLKGSGYALPTRPDENGKPQIVPGCTTVLGALAKDGIVDWAVANTAAYAAANVDQLLNRTETQGFHMLRWYTKRMKPEKFDNPSVDILDYSNGVLDDLANLGSRVHEFVEDYLNDNFLPDLVRPEQVQMAEQFIDWVEGREIEVLGTEITVIGATGAGLPYAGTFDILCRMDGETWLIDTKTSRKVHQTHLGQLASLGAAQSMIVEVSEGSEGAAEYKGKWYAEKPLQGIQRYGILQIRPDDFDHEGNPISAFCKLKEVPQDVIDSAWKLFEGALIARHAERELKDLEKRGVTVE